MSRDYLEDWIALNPDDRPARDALTYLEGLHAGVTVGAPPGPAKPLITLS